MIISKAVLWSILVGFFLFTAAAIYLVNGNVIVTDSGPGVEEVEVRDAW